MKTKISIKLVRHQNAISDQNYEVVSLSNAISVEAGGARIRAGDFITEQQAAHLVELDVYEISTTAKK